MRYEYNLSVCNGGMLTNLLDSMGITDAIVQFHPVNEQRETPLIQIDTDIGTDVELQAAIAKVQSGTAYVVGLEKISTIRNQTKRLEHVGFTYIRPSDSAQILHAKSTIDDAVRYKTMCDVAESGLLTYPIPIETTDDDGFVVTDLTDFQSLVQQVNARVVYLRGAAVNSDSSQGEGLMIETIKTAMESDDLAAVNAVTDTRV